MRGTKTSSATDRGNIKERQSGQLSGIISPHVSYGIQYLLWFLYLITSPSPHAAPHITVVTVITVVRYQRRRGYLTVAIPRRRGGQTLDYEPFRVFITKLYTNRRTY